MSKQLKIYTTKDKEEEKVLRKGSTEISLEEIKTEDFQNFLKNLLYTAQHSEEQGNVPAGGIAAPQVGVNKRVFYILDYDMDVWKVFINPEVTPIDFTKIYTKEGCLSVPDREGEVMRYKKVKIKYLDENGEKKTEKYSDLNAISIQHELDHLEGILFIDRIDN